jgi:hypothetical protein
MVLPEDMIMNDEARVDVPAQPVAGTMKIPMDHGSTTGRGETTNEAQAVGGTMKISMDVSPRAEEATKAKVVTGTMKFPGKRKLEEQQVLIVE